MKNISTVNRWIYLSIYLYFIYTYIKNISIRPSQDSSVRVGSKIQFKNGKIQCSKQGADTYIYILSYNHLYISSIYIIYTSSIYHLYISSIYHLYFIYLYLYGDHFQPYFSLQEKKWSSDLFRRFRFFRVIWNKPGFDRLSAITRLRYLGKLLRTNTCKQVTLKPVVEDCHALNTINVLTFSQFRKFYFESLNALYLE